MITDLKDTKIAKDRLLNMYATLAEGKALYKVQAAVTFNCSLRSIQRDIEDLRSFFAYFRMQRIEIEHEKAFKIN